MITVNIYSDGSFIEDKARWAFLVDDGGRVVHSAGGIIDDPIWNQGRQVGGECRAVIEGIKWCVSNGYKARIYHDYTGLFEWVADYFNKVPWKANTEYTKYYRKYISENLSHITEFVKVKAHSGNKYNEMVDKIAKDL